MTNYSPQQGLADLEGRLIRTPLPAHETFKDDPLRLLRCLRFSTRFGFTLHPDIIAAAQVESIRVGCPFGPTFRYTCIS